jgi:SpoVK/Ycf46/Vps4 family AAA+-type ATPase
MSKRLYIPLPNSVSRKQLIENVIKKEREKKNKYNIDEVDMEEIVLKSKGYSGSDMINVCREAAMMPIRSVEDIFNLQIENLRDVIKDDFVNALAAVKPSVSEKTITQYIDWNKEFGSFQFNMKEIDN